MQIYKKPLLTYYSDINNKRLGVHRLFFQNMYTKYYNILLFYLSVRIKMMYTIVPNDQGIRLIIE